MPNRPQAGDRFTVAGRRDVLIVAECHGSVTDGLLSITRHVVTAVAGSRWSLTAQLVADGVRWIGTALPADPKAPEF